MNLKDKLHGEVFVPVKRAEKLIFNKTTLLSEYLINCGHFDSLTETHIPSGIFEIGDNKIVEIGGLKPTGQCYLLTPEELQKIIGDAFEAGEKRGKELIDSLTQYNK